MEHDVENAEVRELNENIAAANRNVFKDMGLAVLKLVSAPRAGKTSILEQTLPAIRKDFDLAIIEADLYVTFDAERIRATGVPVWQIISRTDRCVDAGLVAQAIQQFPLAGREVLVIETVASDTSPCEYDLGEDFRVAVHDVRCSVNIQGECARMFKTANAILLNKIDLLPSLTISLDDLNAHMQGLNATARILPVSCRTGEGIPAWIAWLREEILRVRADRSGVTSKPAHPVGSAR